MSNDTRPKLIHFLTKSMVDSRVKKGFLKGPYVETGDVLFLQSVIFDMCGIMGRHCADYPIPFFRVLSTREGLEEQAIEVAEKAFNDFVLPYADESFGTIDLIFKNISSRIGFDGDFGKYLSAFGREKLPIERVRQAVSIWGVKGGVTGMRHLEVIDKLIHWTYSSWEQRGFASEQAEFIENSLGKNPMSVEEVERNALDLLEEFCNDFYPDEAKEFF